MRTISEQGQIDDVLEFIRRRAPERAAEMDKLHPGWEECMRTNHDDIHGLERGDILWRMWLRARAWLSNNTTSNG